MGKLGSQNSRQPGLGGSHHLPPYSILCAFPWSPHPNDILLWDSQVGVPKFAKLGLPWLWGRITLCADLRLKWGLKQSCSLRWDLFNIMLQVTCMQGNQIDFLLLVVGNQTANLTFGLSFNYNLCFMCPNESCEPILELFNPLGFDPCNCS